MNEGSVRGTPRAIHIVSGEKITPKDSIGAKFAQRMVASEISESSQYS